MINNQCFVFVLKQRNGEKIYFGLLEIPVTKRYNNDSKSFRNKSPDKDNKLSKYILLIKDNDKTPKFSKQNATRTKTLVKDLLMSKFQ